MNVSTFTVHRSALVAEAMHRRFASVSGMESCGWATSASEALYPTSRAPRVWIVDELLPCSGAKVLCDRVRRRDANGSVLVLAAADSPGDFARLVPVVERGAAGVVDVRSSWPILVKGVRALADGDVWLPRVLSLDLLKSMRTNQAVDDMVIRSMLGLTAREREVLFLLCEGKSRAEIAEALHISAHTARTHVQRVLEKFGVHSQSQIVALALRHRLSDRFRFVGA